MAQREFKNRVTLVDRVSNKLRRIRRGLGGVARRFTQLGAVAGGLAVFGAGRLFAGAIRSARDFESQLAVVQGVTGATRQEFDQLREAAEEAGSTTRFTATEAAEGLEELTRAGQGVSEAVQSLQPTLQTAQANNIEVARSAELLTDSLNQFELAASETGRVADVLTATTQNSATNINLLGEALAKVAPVASQSNLTIEETAATLGRFADFGFRGSEAGTAFRNTLLDLQDPGSKFRAELSKLGIESDDFLTVIQELEKRGGDAEAALRALGRRGVAPLTALVEGGSGPLQGLVDLLLDAEGAASDTADIMDSKLDGALKNLGSAFDALRRNLVQPLLEPIAEQARALADAFRNAANSGAIDRLAQRIRAVFEDGAQQVRDFVAELDFEAAADGAVSALGRVKDAIVGLGRAAGPTLNNIGRLSSGLALTFRSIQSAVLFASAGFTELNKVSQRVLRTQLQLQEAIARALGRTQAADDLVAQIDDVNRRIGALGAVQDEFFRRADEALAGAARSWKDLKASVAGTGAAGKQAGEDIAAGAAQARESISLTRQVVDPLVSLFVRLGDEGKEAGEKVSSGAAKAEQATRGIFDATTQTRREIEGLGQSFGNTGDEFEQAAESGDKTADSLDDIGEAAGRSGEAAQASARQTADAAEQTQAATEQAAGGTAAALARIVGGWQALGGTVAEQSQRIVELTAGSARSVGSFFRALGRRLNRLDEDFQRNAARADELIAAFESGERSATELQGAARALTSELVALDQQRLDGLQQILGEAAQAAERRLGSIQDNVRRLRVEIAELEGGRAEGQAEQTRVRIAELEQQIRQATNADVIEAAKQEIELLERRLELQRQEQREREADRRVERERELEQVQVERIRRVERETTNSFRRIEEQSQGLAAGIQRAMGEALSGAFRRENVEDALEGALARGDAVRF